MKKLKTFEIFGWSKSEKTEKKKSEELEQLKKDILKYNWARLVGQPIKNLRGSSASLFESESVKTIIRHKLILIKDEMPILYKFLPQLWDNGNSYMKVTYEDLQPKHKHDRFIPMIVPATFEFLIDNNNQVLNTDETKQRALNWIMNKIDNLPKKK